MAPTHRKCSLGAIVPRAKDASHPGGHSSVQPRTSRFPLELRITTAIMTALTKITAPKLALGVLALKGDQHEDATVCNRGSCVGVLRRAWLGRRQAGRYGRQ